MLITTVASFNLNVVKFRNAVACVWQFKAVPYIRNLLHGTFMEGQLYLGVAKLGVSEVFGLHRRQNLV